MRTRICEQNVFIGTVCPGGIFLSTGRRDGFEHFWWILLLMLCVFRVEAAGQSLGSYLYLYFTVLTMLKKLLTSYYTGIFLHNLHLTVHALQTEQYQLPKHLSEWLAPQHNPNPARLHLLAIKDRELRMSLTHFCGFKLMLFCLHTQLSIIFIWRYPWSLYHEMFWYPGIFKGHFNRFCHFKFTSWGSIHSVLNVSELLKNQFLMAKDHLLNFLHNICPWLLKYADIE